ncbi:MAG TPA: arylsulfatase [Verrucomicrobiales bacterium]|nr:arylsulfatase [Verrucomicrobiales bacterium]
MKFRRLIIALSLVLAHAFAEVPNVIVILADDMGAGDVAAFNGGRNRTPNIDKLVSEGLWFERAYSGAPVCAPSRAALLTGRYPHRTGVVSLALDKELELTRLKRDEMTVADVFAANGWRTGLVGKWHTGLGEGFGPVARGFQEVACFHGSDGGGYHSYILHTDDRMAEKPRPQDRYLTDELNQRAIAFVRRHAQEPFFLHLAHYAPHRPLQAPEEIIEPYLQAGFDRETATVYAMIEVMDRGIGELMRELDTLGLRERTLILFASDNGPDPLVAPRFNHDLRGTKYEVHEGGIRVPFIARWPGVIKPGKTSAMIHFTDVLPTLVELCGLKHTPKPPLDGRSFAGLLKTGADFATPVRFWQWNRQEPNHTHNAAMRDGPWKLVKPFVTKNKIAGDSDLPHALYHLDNDPAEAADLATQQPERLKTMREALDTWSREVERDRTR